MPQVRGTPPEEQVVVFTNGDLRVFKIVLVAAKCSKPVHLAIFRAYDLKSRPAFRVGGHRRALLYNGKILAMALLSLVQELVENYGENPTAAWLSYYFENHFGVQEQRADILVALKSTRHTKALIKQVIQNSNLRRYGWFKKYWPWWPTPD